MSGTQFDVFFVSKCTHSPFTICSLSRSFTKDLGQLVRAHRKGKGLTLERVSGLGNLSIRFLSEFERGKETA
ncbi:MAG TPA: hypothetical protein ENJ43_02345, partial [Gammaproteobacteria bacterium]|nr:hypothetical protein [Gammaproteobacteria bacterium]